MDRVWDSAAVQEIAMKIFKYYNLRTNLNFQSVGCIPIPESPLQLARKFGYDN